MRSEQADMRRFYGDPNRLAAHVAATYVAEWRSKPGKSKRLGPCKVRADDGSKLTMHEAAVQRAVYEVNRSVAKANSSRDVPVLRPARVEVVKELVRRGRTRRPTSRV